MLTRFLSACLCSLAVAAPVPPFPPKQIEPGTYAVTWSTVNYVYTLDPDGRCTGEPGGWVGWWSWDAKTRIFGLCETNNHWHTWTYYEFPLDRDLGGKCRYSASSGDPDEVPRGVVIRMRAR